MNRTDLKTFLVGPVYFFVQSEQNDSAGALAKAKRMVRVSDYPNLPSFEVDFESAKTEEWITEEEMTE